MSQQSSPTSFLSCRVEHVDVTNCLGRHKGDKSREGRRKLIFQCGIAMHKTRMVQSVQSACIRVGMELGIAGNRGVWEGSTQGPAGSGVSGCTTPQICRLPAVFIELLQPQCVELFPQCLEDLCNACEVFSWNDKILAVVFGQILYLKESKCANDIFSVSSASPGAGIEQGWFLILACLCCWLQLPQLRYPNLSGVSCAWNFWF